MRYAIESLNITLSTLENNEPINRARGDIEQADLEKQGAQEVREALALLNAVRREEELEIMRSRGEI